MEELLEEQLCHQVMATEWLFGLQGYGNEQNGAGERERGMSKGSRGPGGHLTSGC